MIDMDEYEQKLLEYSENIINLFSDYKHIKNKKKDIIDFGFSKGDIKYIMRIGSFIGIRIIRKNSLITSQIVYEYDYPNDDFMVKDPNCYISRLDDMVIFKELMLEYNIG